MPSSTRWQNAAKSLGWPTDFVELSRKQMQSASKMQLQAVDQVMDVWEKQIKAMGSPGQFPSFPIFRACRASAAARRNFPVPGGTFPGMPDFGAGAANPIQFWMQAAEMWQKGWQQAMSTWVDTQQNTMNKTRGGKTNAR